MRTRRRIAGSSRRSNARNVQPGIALRAEPIVPARAYCHGTAERASTTSRKKQLNDWIGVAVLDWPSRRVSPPKRQVPRGPSLSSQAASSGQRSRHRLNRGADRALNRALHAPLQSLACAATPKPAPAKSGAHSKARATVTSGAASNAASPDASTESRCLQPGRHETLTAAWQIGASNGLLRQYLPEGTDLSMHSSDDVEWVAKSSTTDLTNDERSRSRSN
jgi:hypothetical protein